MDYDVILAALSAEQEQRTRDVFRIRKRPASEAQALITDWFRLAEVAHQYALQQREPHIYQAMMSTPAVRKRRDRQLRQGTKAATKAASAIKELVTVVGKYEMDVDRYSEFEAWAESVAAHLQMSGQVLEQKRQWWEARPDVPFRRGTPRWFPQSCLLQVLAAYFRKQSWPVSQAQTSLFAEVALLVLGGERSAMNHVRLRDLAKSRLSYDKLEALAPKGVEFAKPPIRRINPHATT